MKKNKLNIVHIVLLGFFIIGILAVTALHFFPVPSFANQTPESNSFTKNPVTYKTALPDSWELRTETPGILNTSALTDMTPASTESLLSEEGDLLYYQAQDAYCYGITKTGQEVISFLHTDGTKIDALNGAGTFAISNSNGEIISYASYISDLQIVTDAAVPTIRLSYAQTMGNSTTLYEFYPEYIKVTAQISDFPMELCDCYGALIRSFPQSYVEEEKKLSYKWVFPENEDFPYPTIDSYVQSHYIDSTHKLYTVLRDESANLMEYFEYTSETDVALRDMTGSDYTLAYTIVPANLTPQKNSDYLALFQGNGKDYAAGIVALTSQDSSTVFDGYSQFFNLNVTNLTETTAHYQMDYQIYSYNGDLCSSDTLSFSLAGKEDHNENIYFESSQTGIYFLDYTVSSDTDTYHELFSFMLLGERSDSSDTYSPFGISGMHFGAYEPNDTTISLAARLGIRNVRVGISTPEYIGTDFTLLERCLKKLNDRGIHVTGQFLVTSDWTIPENTDSYTLALDAVLNSVHPYLDAVEVGNEPNMIEYYGFSSYTDAMNYYQNSQVLPTYQLITQKYQLPFMSAGVFLSQSDWLELMAQNGLFQASSILSTHAYSYPHSPDLTSDPAIEHSFESALVRTRSFLDRYGDKTWYLSEFGLPTTPLNTEGTFSGADLRTQADFSIRSYILALSYGVDVVEGYSFYDQHNMFKGLDETNGEFHFGMFYNQDYYGRVMPKPLAMAYAGMTKQLSAYESCQELPTDSQTLRCFAISLKDTEVNENSMVYVLWSTKERLTNDCADGYRTPNLPWQNQWSEQEPYLISTMQPVTVCDLFGNETIYEPINGIVSIPVTGSPIYLYL